MFFYFENRSYFTPLFCINKETKNLLQPQAERPKPVSDQLFRSNGLKTRTCFLSCSSFLTYSLRATWIFRSQWLVVSRVGYYFIFSGFQCCFGHSKPGSLQKFLQGYKVVWNTAQVAFNFSLAKVMLNFNCVQNIIGFFPADMTQGGFLFRILRPNQKLNLCKHISLVCIYMIKCYDIWNNGCMVPVCDVEMNSCVAHVSLLREY